MANIVALIPIKGAEAWKTQVYTIEFKNFHLGSNALCKIYFYLFDFNDKQHIKALLICYGSVFAIYDFKN